MSSLRGLCSAANYVFAELAKRHLQHLPKEEFVERLAYYYDKPNYIHPFREGNGRAQRVFWNRVARNARYEIERSLITGDENNEASRLVAEQMDLSKLEAMLTRIVE